MTLFPYTTLFRSVPNSVSEQNSFSVLANLSDLDIPTSHILAQDPWTLHTVPPSPVSSSVDRQNPWEVALHQEKEKKRKGKAAATLDEPRNSLRVKLNQMVGDPKDVQEGAAGKPLVKAKTGTNFLLEQFPFSALLDVELVNLYDVSGFKLGGTLDESLMIVKSLRLLSKPSFVSVINDSVTTGQITLPVISKHQIPVVSGNEVLSDSSQL